MARKSRIAKPVQQRVDECETHLYFLWCARGQFKTEKDRYKQIAAELRVLVGDHRPERRLLLSLMDKFGFTYHVQPPPPPFDNRPIPMVGWKEDPAHQALTAEAQASLGDNAKMEAFLQKQAALRRPVPFPEYVEKALAVCIALNDYSYRDLVLAVSQQVGSGHEDTAMEEPLVLMGQIFVGGIESYIAPLVNFTDLVLEVGRQFFGFLVAKHDYEPRYFLVPD